MTATQGQGAGVHTCAHPSCDQRGAGTMLACREHWFQLPAKLRRPIWSWWRVRLNNPDNVNAVSQHTKAVQKAVEFWDAAGHDSEAST